MEAEITSQAVGLSSTDFSIIKLFVRADIIVKSVILILIAASIYSWAIIFDKYKLFKKINKSSDEFEDKNLKLCSLFRSHKGWQLHKRIQQVSLLGFYS